MSTSELRSRALRWLADDPDPDSRAQLRALIDALPASTAELADRFAGYLRFGTAGLRGPMRAGSNGMNLAVVRTTTAGLVSWLAERDAGRPVVIGYDARFHSREFARQAARVVTGAGRPALLMPRALPTPVLAHAVRAAGACAGVMVTASHNPPQDNGYKVYLGAGLGGPGGDGAQLVPPADAEIEAATARSYRAPGSVSLGVPGTVIGEEVVKSYLDTAVSVIDPGLLSAAERANLSVAYTPMHGVGAETLTEAFTRSGFAAPAAVPQQVDPDPAFPTVAFPNPEEPGAMDLLLALAESVDADLAIANDPDADRCAVAIPTRGPAGVPPNRRWRALTGDEVGVLLADHMMRRGVRGLFSTTVVSSSLLRELCAARGQAYGETLTGFKWIVRAAEPGRAPGDGLVYGYEEALGYCVAPGHVRDKDGITAALLVAELAASLKARHRSLADRLDELATEFGVHATDQISVRVNDLPQISQMMARLRERPPAHLLDEPVISVEDLRPDADVLTLRSASSRVVVRPSGTEPKLKAYLEVVEPVTGVGAAVGAAGAGATGVVDARGRAAAMLARLRAQVTAALHG